MSCTTGNKIFQRRGRGRPRIHTGGGFGQQPNSDIPSRLDVLARVRLLGIGRRGVQGTRRHRRDVERQHIGVRPGKPQGSSFLVLWYARFGYHRIDFTSYGGQVAGHHTLVKINYSAAKTIGRANNVLVSTFDLY